MIQLPYISPDNELNLNISLLLLMLEKLSSTARRRLILNNERIRAYLYLIKNPTVLNKVLKSFGYQVAQLETYDEYSVASIAGNVDSFYDESRLKYLLITLAGFEYIEVEYKKNDGFLYKLSDAGLVISEKLHDDYFSTVRLYMDAMTCLSSVSIGNINSVIEEKNHE